MLFFNIDIESELYIIFIIFVILFIMIFHDRYKYNKNILNLSDIYNQEINILKDTINSINEKNKDKFNDFHEELNKQTIKYYQSVENINKLLYTNINDQDQSLETIFDVISSIDHKHTQSFEENSKTLEENTNQISNHTQILKNINESLEKTYNINISYGKTLKDINKCLEDINNKMSNYDKSIEDVNNKLNNHGKSLEDIYNTISDHTKSLKDNNNYPDIIYPIRLLSYKFTDSSAKDDIIHEGTQYYGKYNNKCIDIKSIDSIKFKLLYNSTNIIGLYVYINEIPFNTLGLSECLYNYDKYKSERNLHCYRTYSTIGTGHNSSIDNEYNTVYKIFEKIFCKSDINNICIEVDVYRHDNNYNYNNDSSNGAKYIKDTNKKLYNELIIKLCNLYKLDLDIKINTGSYSDSIITTINNDNFEILDNTNNKCNLNIFRLDDILLNEINNDNILNINFTIYKYNNKFNYYKIQEYIKKKLNSRLLEKCIFKIIDW